MQSYGIEDFSGGITDNFIGCAANEFERLKNFFITEDKKLNTRSGSELDISASDARAVVSGNTPIQAILPPFGTGSLFYKISNRKFVYDTGATLAEAVGPTSNSLFSSTLTAGKLPSFTFWNDHYYICSESFDQKTRKVYIDTAISSTVPQVRNAGLPKIATTPTITFGGGAFRYAFCYKYTYTVGGRTFIDRGEPVYTASAAGGNGATVTFPAGSILANGATENYATASIIIEIYRTTDGGTVFYKLPTPNLGEYANASGAGTFADTTTDAVLTASGTSLYTNGGRMANSEPPVSKYLHVAETGFGYYAHCKDQTSSEVCKNRFYQTIQGTIGAVPASFFGEVDDELVGVTSYKGIPILLGKNKIYRVEGRLDAFGNGTLAAKTIGNNVGGASHWSCVQTPLGVFFAGTTGFYWTDGYQLLKISEQLNSSYLTLYPDDTTKAKTYGGYDEFAQRVWWTYSDSSVYSTNSCLVLHLRFGISPKMPFTTIGGYPDIGADNTVMAANFSAVCLTFHAGYMYRGDRRGYTFKHVSTLKTDPKVITTDAVTIWGTTVIKYDMRTGAIHFGTTRVRKWTPKVDVVLKNRGNISLQIQADRDLKSIPKSMKEIKHTTSFNWADAGILWGDPIIYSSDKSLFEDQRRLRTPGLRCMYRAIWATNADTIIQKSDNLGLVTITNSGGAGNKTALLVNAASYDWPTDVLDYYLTFVNDSYVIEYPIVTRSDDTLTFYDANNVCPVSGNYKWELKGWAKGEVAHIMAINIPFDYLSDSQDDYTTGDEGANA